MEISYSYRRTLGNGNLENFTNSGSFPALDNSSEIRKLKQQKFTKLIRKLTLSSDKLSQKLKSEKNVINWDVIQERVRLGKIIT